MQEVGNCCYPLLLKLSRFREFNLCGWQRPHKQPKMVEWTTVRVICIGEDISRLYRTRGESRSCDPDTKPASKMLLVLHIQKEISARPPCIPTVRAIDSARPRRLVYPALSLERRHSAGLRTNSHSQFNELVQSEVRCERIRWRSSRAEQQRVGSSPESNKESEKI